MNLETNHEVGQQLYNSKPDTAGCQKNEDEIISSTDLTQDLGADQASSEE